jgi:hypothetical protein
VDRNDNYLLESWALLTSLRKMGPAVITVRVWVDGVALRFNK